MSGLYCVMMVSEEPPKEKQVALTIGDTIVYVPVIEMDIDYSGTDTFVKCINNMIDSAKNLKEKEI